MGYSLSWIAVHGNSSDRLNDLLQIRPTAVREDFAESKCTSARLPGGHYLVIFNHKELSPGLLKNLSRSLPLIYGSAEEHVMYSSVASWEDGKEQWAVVHDAQKGISDLEVRGTPPEQYHAIRKRLFAEQTADGGGKAEVDHIFDIPVELAYELIGYRYDRDVNGMSENGFEVMEAARKPGFFARLAGRE